MKCGCGPCQLSLSDPFTRVLIANQCFAFVSTGFMNYGLSSGTLSNIKSQFHLSYLQTAGQLIAVHVSTVLMTIASPWIPRCFPKMPFEQIAILGCILSAIGAAIFAGAQAYWMLLLGQVFNGAGSALINVYYPTMYSFLAETPSKIADGVGKTSMVVPPGIVAAFLLVAVAGGEKWRWWYAIASIAFVIPTTLYALIVRSYRTHDPRIIEGSPPSFREIVLAVAAKPNIVCQIFAVSFATFVIAAYTPFLPDYLQKHLGQSAQTASFFMAATIPVISVAMGLGGWIVHRYHIPPAKIMRTSVGVAVLCAGLATAVFVPDLKNFWAFSVMVLVIMFTIFILSAPSLACVSMLLPRHLVSHGNASMGIVIRGIGSVGGPLTIGALLDNGVPYNWSFLAVGGAMLIAGVLFCFAWLLTRGAGTMVWVTPGTTPSATPAGSPMLPPMPLRNISNTTTTSLGPYGDAGEATAMSLTPKERDETGVWSPMEPFSLQPIDNLSRSNTPEPQPSSPLVPRTGLED